MRKGFWNYSEPIKYRVLLVMLNPPDPSVKMHWQNAFVGQHRQIVQIIYTKPDESDGCFYIDNEDGSGVLKIEARGGPMSMHRSVDEGTFDVLEELPLISQWNKWNPTKCKDIDAAVSEWQREKYPEEYARLEALRAKIADLRKR